MGTTTNGMASFSPVMLLAMLCAAGGLASPIESPADTCHLYDISDGTCGQSDLDCKYAPYAKDFQSGLKDGTCAAQGYTVPAGTRTIHVPFIGDITVSTYNKTAVEVATVASSQNILNSLFGSDTATCSKIGDCGRAYQACCIAFEAKGYPCGCSLQDGNGTAGETCGDCGTAYSACCIGFSARGYPCECSVA